MAVALAVAFGGLTGCRSASVEPVSMASATATAPSRETMSYYERRLVELAERQKDLEARVRANPELEANNVERPFREISSAYQSLIADNPETVEARLLYGKFLDFFGDREGARDQFAEVLRRDETVAVAYQQLGTYFAEEGDFGRAMAYYLTAIEREPEEPLYHLALGELLHAYRPQFLAEAGFTEVTLETQMLSALQRAAELEPDSLAYQFRYGEAFYDLYDPDWTVALAHWERMAVRDDLTGLQRDVILLHRARCLGELERYDLARDLARRVDREGLRATQEALLEAIDEAEARGNAAG